MQLEVSLQFPLRDVYDFCGWWLWLVEVASGCGRWMWLVDVAGVCVWDVTVVICVADGSGWWMCLGCDGCDFCGWWLWLVDVAGGCGRWMWPVVVAGGCVWDVKVVFCVAGGCGWWMCLGRDRCEFLW